MATTYDPTKLAERGKDRMRFDLGDTNMADPLLMDEEIQIILDENLASWRRAQLKCSEKIAEKFAPETTIKVGSLTIDLAARAEFWAKKVADLRKQCAGLGAPIAAASAGGQGDSAGSYFRTGMHDNNEG